MFDKATGQLKQFRHGRWIEVTGMVDGEEDEILRSSHSKLSEECVADVLAALSPNGDGWPVMVDGKEACRITDVGEDGNPPERIVMDDVVYDRCWSVADADWVYAA